MRSDERSMYLVKIVGAGLSEGGGNMEDPRRES